jgi:predicted RNase H-like HicB family nuclease
VNRPLFLYRGVAACPNLHWSDEDQAFIAEVPEPPGCMADGTTYQEAVANVERIIGEWIETAQELGRPIPKPRGRLMFA